MALNQDANSHEQERERLDALLKNRPEAKELQVRRRWIPIDAIDASCIEAHTFETTTDNLLAAP